MYVRIQKKIKGYGDKIDAFYQPGDVFKCLRHDLEKDQYSDNVTHWYLLKGPLKHRAFDPAENEHNTVLYRDPELPVDFADQPFAWVSFDDIMVLEHPTNRDVARTLLKDFEISDAEGVSE